MKIQAGGNITQPKETTRSYLSPVHSAVQTRRTDAARRFDSITISGRDSGVQGGFEAELRSRLRQDVLASTPASVISELRAQVQSGVYQVDASEIAKKMVLFGEG